MSDSNNNQGSDQQQFMVVNDSPVSSAKVIGAKDDPGKVQDTAAQHVYGLESKQLVAAAMEVAQVLGPSVRPFIAQAGRVYDGPIVHIKDGLAFQQTGSDSAVIHKVGDIAGDMQKLKSLAYAVNGEAPVSIDYTEKGAPVVQIVQNQQHKLELSHAKDVGGQER